MRQRRKYRVSQKTLRLMRIVSQHPGINAAEFGAAAWPHLRYGAAGIAAQKLRAMKNKGLIRIKYSGDPFKVRAHCIYYLSDYGYEVCEHTP
jgi:hypothetical protein